jgi:hypothetical protein
MLDTKRAQRVGDALPPRFVGIADGFCAIWPREYIAKIISYAAN